VKWAKSDLPELAEGKSYLFKNVITDEYQGRFSLKLSSTTQIEGLNEDIQVGSSVAEFAGAIVEIQKGSGLIKRCSICRRAVQGHVWRTWESGRILRPANKGID